MGKRKLNKQYGSSETNNEIDNNPMVIASSAENNSNSIKGGISRF
jgi:hypothetical protein